MAEQRRIAQQENQRWKVGQKVRQAIEQDDLLTLTQSVVEAQQKGIFDEDYLQKLPEHDSWLARMVKSEKIAEFLLSQIDTKSKAGATFAEDMIDHVLNDEIAPADKAIELAKKYDVSLKKAADHADKEALLKCLAAGFNAEDYDFMNGLGIYYKYKDGYTKQISQNDDIDVPPDLEKAAEQKEILIEVLKAGYPLDVEKIKDSKDFNSVRLYGFLKEVAHDRETEQKYAKLSAEDKQIVAHLKSDNGYDIERVRDAIGDGVLKPEIVEYMNMLKNKERGNFMNYYNKIMVSSMTSEPYSSLNEAEKCVLRDRGLGQLKETFEMRPRCTKELKEQFGKEFFSSLDTDDLKTTRYFYSDLSPLGKDLLADYISEHFEEKMKEIDTSSKIDFHEKGEKRIRFLAVCLELNSQGLEYPSERKLKNTLLKYRTSVSLEERKQKANYFAEALKESKLNKTSYDDIHFHKAVSKVSYTPASSLNKYSRMVEKEEEKAEITVKARQAVKTKKSQTR